MTKKQLKQLIKEVIREEQSNELNEGYKDIVAAMAILGASIFVGVNTYQNYQLREKWKAAYEQIQQTHPDEAVKIKELIKRHKSLHSKYFGRRNDIEGEMDNILKDLNIKIQ